MSCSTYSCVAVPPGNYIGTLIESRIVCATSTRTPGVCLYWEVDDNGVPTRVWRTLWLSPAAMRWSKRELAGLGVQSLGDLDHDPPVAPGAICRLVVADIKNSEGCIERTIVKWKVLSLPSVILDGKGVSDGRH